MLERTGWFLRRRDGAHAAEAVLEQPADTLVWVLLSENPVRAMDIVRDSTARSLSIRPSSGKIKYSGYDGWWILLVG